MNISDNEELRSRHLPLALHHANLIQQQKDIQMDILSSLEELIEFPTSNNADPANPTAKDLAAFRTLVASFQQSDFDELIEERNCIKKCGYVFCPRPFERTVWDTRPGDEIRFVFGKVVPGKGRMLTVMPNHKVHRWCDGDCAKLAMYIKVQLSQTPAWLRDRSQEKPIQPLREHATGEQIPLTDSLGRLTLSDDAGHDELRDAMANLAIERGDLVKDSGKKSASVAAATTNLVIRENPSQNRPSAQVGDLQGQPAGSADHMSIDGYTPRLEGANSAGQTTNRMGEREEDNWDLFEDMDENE